MAKRILLDGDSLTIDQVMAVARAGTPAGLAPSSRRRMQQSRAWVERPFATMPWSMVSRLDSAPSRMSPFIPTAFANFNAI